MSYILEALKKAERKRPPGQVPDLFTVQGPAASPKPRRPLLAVVAGASLVAAFALGGWAWFGGRDRQSPAPPARPPDPKPAAIAVPAPPVAATPVDIPGPAERPPAVNLPAARPAAPTAAGSRRSSTGLSRAEVGRPAAPAAVESETPRPGPVPAESAAPADGAAVQPAAPPPADIPVSSTPAEALSGAVISPPPRSPAPQVVAAPPAPTAIPEIPTPAPAVVAEPAAPRREAAAEVPPADGRILSIDELPAEVRKQLGSFAVSGHVWSEEPSLRLLTVQNRIVREGGEAAPGVRLEEITQSGAVFTYQGWRFRTGF